MSAQEDRRQQQRPDVAWPDALLERERALDARQGFLDGVAAAQDEEAHRLRVRDAVLAEREAAFAALVGPAAIAAAAQAQSQDKEAVARRRAGDALAEALAKLAKAELEIARATGDSAARAREMKAMRAERASLRERLAKSDSVAAGLRAQCVELAERLAASEVLVGSLRAKAAAWETSYEAKVAELKERRQMVEREAAKTEELQQMQEHSLRELQGLEAELQRRRTGVVEHPCKELVEFYAKPEVGGA